MNEEENEDIIRYVLDKKKIIEQKNHLIMKSQDLIMTILEGDSEKENINFRADVAIKILSAFVSMSPKEEKNKYISYVSNKIKKLFKVKISKKELEEYCDKSGFVYILKCNKFYKIGRSKNIDRRLSKINTAMPYKIKLFRKYLVKDCNKLETKLHRKYKSKRVNGEWFKLDKDDLTKIDQILNSELK